MFARSFSLGHCDKLVVLMFSQNSDILVYINLKKKTISYFEFKLGGLIEIIGTLQCPRIPFLSV